MGPFRRSSIKEGVCKSTELHYDPLRTMFMATISRWCSRLCGFKYIRTAWKLMGLIRASNITRLVIMVSFVNIKYGLVLLWLFKEHVWVTKSRFHSGVLCVLNVTLP